ncbi:dTDP-4-dehydrorhamnose reductase [Paenibacillus sp. MMS18-CY102]|uniref:dTDP-4-dehydrorhamnose reductase n=1 Tax=Paenibacillus sp. MMS18-CY102 TaxID=2682849 RepID=UPI0013656501|nr:dTDP-4-dehydrorhamnose reductase [Paenibacillus sp. MMS18-CY102]MWC27296.1 dTDP-4-dehydrorhamnose reductase [Paenibacillus sp. MMS18-CY102]
MTGVAEKFRVLVTGANGQLGRELALWATAEVEGLDIRGYGRDDLDITDLEQCRAVIKAFAPHAVIHCAAYTAVDQAEADPDGAFRVNATGTRNIALAAREVGAKLAYVSTDYVFDGTSAVPYNEYDRPNPRTVYGKSKLAGEELVRTLHDRHFVVRTSWVYGAYGANFVKTMVKVGAERGAVKVVHDQIGSPTYTFDLAAMLLELVRTDAYGVYHASNAGTCSWYEFAVAIFEESGLQVSTEPCTTEEFPRPAPRPAFSVMDHSAMRTNGLTPMRHWREALRDYLAKQ